MQAESNTEVDLRLKNIEQIATGIKESIAAIPVVTAKKKFIELHFYVVAYLALGISIIALWRDKTTTTTQSINIDSLEKLLENDRVIEILRRRGEIE